MDPIAEPITTEDLGRSYAAVLGNPGWQGEEREAAVAPETEAPPDPLRIIEALFFVGGGPLTAQKACEIIRGLTREQFAASVVTLNQDYRRQGRPYTLQAQDQGYLLTLRPRFRGVVEKVYGGPREARLSMAAIDVLALVAYRQPAVKAEIDSFRGADSGSLLRQLIRRGLIQVIDRDDTPPAPSREAQEKEETPR